jgi:hypothetical protein
MIKLKVILWGAGIMAQSYLPFADAAFSGAGCDILFIVDSDTRKWGVKLNNYTIKSPDALLEPGLSFDKIIITVGDDEILQEIQNTLIAKYTVSHEKICSFKGDYFWSAHEEFIRGFARISSKRMYRGNVAELGVFRGATAAQLNKLFPNKKLFLFDTFEGFDPDELSDDTEKYSSSLTSVTSVIDIFKDTSVETVLSKMRYPENVIIKKGYFPSTFDLHNESFCFVHIDPDLYAPTKSGLELFYPRVEHKGIILVHDYFEIEGVTKAVDEFLSANKDALSIPIGDFRSLAIIKP